MAEQTVKVDRSYCHYRHAEEAVMKWISDAGYDPDEVNHVLVGEDPTVLAVWVFARDENGRRYVDPDTGEAAGAYHDLGDVPPIPVALPWDT